MVRKASQSKGQRKSARAKQAERSKDIAERIAALDRLPKPNPQAARAIALFRSWLMDESGYDEETWPRLKKALDRERRRVGARRLFGD